jgi:hypothetical protein
METAATGLLNEKSPDLNSFRVTLIALPAGGRADYYDRSHTIEIERDRNPITNDVTVLTTDGSSVDRCLSDFERDISNSSDIINI